MSGHGITFREALRVWCKIGIHSFGGPAGQIAVMHRELVEKKRWISEARFLHALNYCMLLPGPEAMQLATYIGWLLHGTLGGLTAGILFVLPGFLSLLGLSVVYAGFQGVGFVQGLFFGLKPAVLAVVIEAVLRIGRRVLKNNAMWAIAAGAFVGIFFLNIPFPIIIFLAGLIGFVGGRLKPGTFLVIQGPGTDQECLGKAIVDEALDRGLLPHAWPSYARAWRVLATWLTLWIAPVAVLSFVLGREHLFVQQAAFFGRAAVVTFGGAYSVLAYIAQRAVETYGWLQPNEMIDGLGMAETTPGPLIQVVQFVGFLGAYRQPGGLHPMLAGVFASVIVNWVTYVPCFLYIFLGAPYIEALRNRDLLRSALSSITAAVVGVVLNLAVWFSLHTLFVKVDVVHLFPLRLWVPQWSTAQPPSLVLALVALVALFRFKIGMIRTFAGCVVLGAGYYAITTRGLVPI